MANSNVEVRIADLKEVAKISPKIIEFDEVYNEEYFANKIAGKKNLVIVGYVEDRPAGYMVSYEQDADGSFYCWMAAVDPGYRRQGVLSSLLEYLINWARQEGFSRITIKTRNTRREMLAFLVNKGFNFTQVEAYPEAENNRIYLEKSIVT